MKNFYMFAFVLVFIMVYLTEETRAGEKISKIIVSKTKNFRKKNILRV
jgi:hypothetical protein